MAKSKDSFMAHSAHLYRVSKTYYVRVRIPKELKCWFGIDDFKRSLKTKSLTTAKQLSKLWAAKTDRLFSLMRTGMLTDSQIFEMVRDYYNCTLREIEDFRSDGLFIPKDEEDLEYKIDSLKSALPDMREALAYNHIKVIENVADVVLEQSNLRIDRDSPSYTKLCRELLKAAIKITEIDLQHMCGDYSTENLEERYTVIPVTQPASPAPVTPSMLLSQLINLYVQENMAQASWSDKTRQEIQSQLEMFIELLGDIKVRSITRKTMVDCLATMKRLPARRQQLEEYRDKTIKEILELDHIPNPLGTLTIKKRMTLISSLFKWANKHDHMEKNPAEGLAPREKRPADQQRKIYPQGLLQKMVNVLSEKYRHKGNRPDRWWIPIIGLYTGLRLDEICQLYKDDVKQIEGVWCFDVNDNKDKKLKNPNSVRTVPLHSALINLGFLEYCESVDHERLWQHLKKGKNGYSNDYGKWFQKLNRRHITEDSGMVFHSFRHNFIDALKQAGAQEQAIIELAGHSKGSVTMGRYGKPYNAPVLLEAVKMLAYDIDLSPLK